MTHRPDLDAVLFELEGVLCPQDYQGAIEALLKAPYFHPDINTIWDFRKADMTRLTADAIRSIALHSERTAPLRGTTWKTALLVQGALSFGLARMFDGYTVNAPYRMETFLEMEKAEAWLKQKTTDNSNVPR